MGDEKILWRRELCLFLYVISPCLDFFPQFLQLENRVKDVNCTNITDEMAPGRLDPITFSCQSDNKTRPALQRRGMNWPGICSTDFRVCFPNWELGLRSGERKGCGKGRNKFHFSPPADFHPYLLLFPSPPSTF